MLLYFKANNESLKLIENPAAQLEPRGQSTSALNF